MPPVGAPPCIFRHLLYVHTVNSDYRSHLKNRILVQGRGGAEFQTGGPPQADRNLKRGTNKDIGPKDIFEIASI